MNKSKSIFRLLQFSTAFVFLGRAWQHFFFSGPYRELLWDEKRFSWFAKNIFGFEWSEWTTNLSVDRAVLFYDQLLSLIFVVAAISSFFVNKKVLFPRFAIKLGSFFLLLLALVYWKDQFFNFGQLFEHAIQIAAPLFLLGWGARNKNMQHFFLWMRIMIAITFISHGFYAIGFYPIPSTFIEMTTNILTLSEENAVVFLKIMGMLDFVAAIFILVPSSRLIKLGLTYCAFWGLLTAIARPIAFYYPEFWMESLHQWIYQAVFRLPHGLLPLAALLFQRSKVANKL